MYNLENLIALKSELVKPEKKTSLAARIIQEFQPAGQVYEFQLELYPTVENPIQSVCMYCTFNVLPHPTCPN